jgi:hypothetical protein
MTRSRDTASIIPTVDAKGDLLVGTANNEIDNLSPGTNGQVLTANSATTTGLEWNSSDGVRVFANSAARATAIPSPAEGTYTQLNDTDRLEFWNGSAWISPFGLTLLATAAPSGSYGVSFNNVFSSSYQNYQIYVNCLGSTTAGLNLRLRVAGEDATTNYQFQYLEANSGTVSASADASSQIFAIGAVSATNRIFGVSELSNPFAAQQTSFNSRTHIPPYNMSLRSGVNNNNTSYDGCTIYPSSGTMSGSIRIYGVRD